MSLDFSRMRAMAEQQHLPTPHGVLRFPMMHTLNPQIALQYYNGNSGTRSIFNSQPQSGANPPQKVVFSYRSNAEN
jgi:hypothetical protein